MSERFHGDGKIAYAVGLFSACLLFKVLLRVRSDAFAKCQARLGLMLSGK